MKLVHSIQVSVFVKKGEDENACKEAMLSLVPFLELEKFEPREKILKNIRFTRNIAEGFESKIIIIDMAFDKEKYTVKFLELLRAKLCEEDISRLYHQQNRVDEECFLYLRLDKKKLLDGECALTDSGDCFHIKMSIAAFPKKREIALEIVKRIFGTDSVLQKKQP